jgi:hypothetical protein
MVRPPKYSYCGGNWNFNSIGGISEILKDARKPNKS